MAAPLKRGSNGPEVTAWQSYLQGQGYAVTVDGDFGAETEAATRAFQIARGLSVDGVVGAATLRATTPSTAPSSAPAKVSKLSDAGRALIKRFEGLKLTAYPDGKNADGSQRYSVGYGHNGVEKGTTITAAAADVLFDRDVASREQAVMSITPRIRQHEFDAFVSLAYNIGVAEFSRSTCARRHNAGDTQGAADSILWFNQSNGAVDPVLVDRRERERAVYLHANYSGPIDGAPSAGSAGSGGAKPPSSTVSQTSAADYLPASYTPTSSSRSSGSGGVVAVLLLVFFCPCWASAKGDLSWQPRRSDAARRSGRPPASLESAPTVWKRGSTA